MEKLLVCLGKGKASSSELRDTQDVPPRNTAVTHSGTHSSHIALDKEISQTPHQCITDDHIAYPPRAMHPTRAHQSNHDTYSHHQQVSGDDETIMRLRGGYPWGDLWKCWDWECWSWNCGLRGLGCDLNLYCEGDAGPKPTTRRCSSSAPPPRPSDPPLPPFCPPSPPSRPRDDKAVYTPEYDSLQKSVYKRHQQELQPHDEKRQYSHDHEQEEEHEHKSKGKHHHDHDDEPDHKKKLKAKDNPETHPEQNSSQHSRQREQQPERYYPPMKYHRYYDGTWRDNVFGPNGPIADMLFSPRDDRDVRLRDFLGPYRM